eukprot:6472030-Amphidinium_carterae.4
MNVGLSRQETRVRIGRREARRFRSNRERPEGEKERYSTAERSEHVLPNCGESELYQRLVKGLLLEGRCDCNVWGEGVDGWMELWN